MRLKGLSPPQEPILEPRQSPNPVSQCMRDPLTPHQGPCNSRGTGAGTGRALVGSTNEHLTHFLTPSSQHFCRTDSKGRWWLGAVSFPDSYTLTATNKLCTCLPSSLPCPRFTQESVHGPYKARMFSIRNIPQHPRPPEVQSDMEVFQNRLHGQCPNVNGATPVMR